MHSNVITRCVACGLSKNSIQSLSFHCSFSLNNQLDCNSIGGLIFVCYYRCCIHRCVIELLIDLCSNAFFPVAHLAIISDELITWGLILGCFQHKHFIAHKNGSIYESVFSNSLNMIQSPRDRLGELRAWTS